MSTSMLRDEMAFTAGGQEFKIQRMRFKQLKVAWPAITRIAELGKLQFPQRADGTFVDVSSDPNFMVWHAEKLELMLKVITSAMQRTQPQMTQDKLEDMLDLYETKMIPDKFNELLGISGFELGNGQGEMMAEMSPQSSTETGTLSSPSSSQMVSVAATGNESKAA
jgi:hypothetical protein